MEVELLEVIVTVGGLGPKKYRNLSPEQDLGCLHLFRIENSYT